MATVQDVRPPKGRRVHILFETINRTTEDVAEREALYDEVAESELKKLTKTLDVAIKKKASMIDLWQALMDSGELQEMLATLFLAAKAEHRVTISYLYDMLNAVFGIAQTEMASQLAAQQAKQQVVQ